MPPSVIDSDDLLDTPDDHFIKGVFNYCHRWCERCPFTARCRVYADVERDQQTYPNDTWIDRIQRSQLRAVELLKQWCAREGIDFDRVSGEADAADAPEIKIGEEMRNDPLQKQAEL